MKYSSDILFRLGQAVPVVQLSGDEQELLVPSVLAPIVSVVGPLRRISGFSNSAAQRESFFNTRTLGQVASAAAAEGLLCTFGEGLWRVRVQWSHLANFTQVSDGTITNANILHLLDPGGTATGILKTYSVNAVPQHLLTKWVWLFTEDGWQLQLRVGATGVAQTQEIETQVMAERLL